MATKEKGPALNPDPHQTPATAPEQSLTISVVQPATRLPGEWPDAYASGLRDQWLRERARRELVTSSIRAHLAEQPNARAVRLCARRWINDIHFIADGVIAVLDSTETEE